jgi:multidrug resistance efflux pump
VQSAQAALDANLQAQTSNAAQIRLAQAQASSSQAALAKTQVDIKRAEPLLAQGWLAPSQRDVLQVAQRQAAAGVAQTEANIDIARQALATTKVNREGLEATLANARRPSNWPASTWPTPPSAPPRTERSARSG